MAGKALEAMSRESPVAFGAYKELETAHAAAVQRLALAGAELIFHREKVCDWERHIRVQEGVVAALAKTRDEILREHGSPDA